MGHRGGAVGCSSTLHVDGGADADWDIFDRAQILDDVTISKLLKLTLEKLFKT